MPHDLVASYVDRLPVSPAPDQPLFRNGPGEVGGQFYGARLASVFQAVRGPEGRLVGHQGLLRVRAARGGELSPWRLFADAASDADLVQLDRLARTVHALNYFGAAESDTRLFLAVEQRLLDAVHGAHGQHFARILTRLAVAPARVTIVLPAGAGENPGFLADVLGNYRRAGFGVEVRLPDIDPARVARLAVLRPDAVRVQFAPAAASAWCEFADAARAAGAASHVTHVEEPGALERLAAAGVEWLQGYAFATPAILPRRPRSSPPPPPKAPAPAPEDPRPTRFRRIQPGDLEQLPLWISLW